jgi:hypothetical protein
MQMTILTRLLVLRASVARGAARMSPHQFDAMTHGMAPEAAIDQALKD